ncbi:Gfo/Idh/MocA family oxidoreductase [Solitalea lacus]|uniref:Gfo/Idh/MocA family oxidoreductase n=1 Tax=Solitalea lacus TaxID=2911172 RepID=UPI001EDA2893|nr:Gfo/Idh/MocA family oxidoreductase [Solitalea lacus]UKJ06653.1 Gfo/Idh/MocA family oxidoreductase [Solitalea lacus]
MLSPITTGICSFGYSTKVFHAPLIINNHNFKWTAVVERNNEASKEQYPQLTIYKSVDDLLKDDSLELIIVNTPNQTHYDLAKKALLANKHVIIDKPFTATAAEAKELISLANERQKMLSVFHNRRWDGDYLIVKNVIESEALGRLVEADFRFERFKTELNPKKHKEEAAPATGLLYEIGTHIIDQAIALFGMPQSLFADIRKTRDGSLVDDYFELLLFYPNFRLKLKSTILAKEELPGYILHGTNGSFIKKRMNLQEMQLAAGMTPFETDYGVEPEAEWGILNIINDGVSMKKQLPTPVSNYAKFYELVYDHIRNKGPVPVNPQDAMKGIQLIEAAYKSNITKQVVNL